MQWDVADTLPCSRVQVTLSSLNRHALATRADVGLPKATVLERHFREILPEARVRLFILSINLINPNTYVQIFAHRHKGIYIRLRI